MSQTVGEIRKIHEKHKIPAREFCQTCVVLDALAALEGKILNLAERLQ